ncbi:PhyH-domain-containing protein [Xylaria intraflava]|nr:PhyH-domain-containing protein [Xylaria intraflava]
MTSYKLSDAQVEQYHRDGFLLVPVTEHRLVDAEDLRAWTDEVHSWPREVGKWMPYDEINVRGERQLMRTECFVDYHAQFDALLRGDALRGILAQLNHQTPMLLFKDKINYKSSNGNGFQAHLDAPAYDHIGKIEHITANICVNEATRENGFLEVVAGSHRMQVQLIDGGRIHPDWQDAQTWTELPMQSGDILFFGSHLAHRSGPNTSPTPRSMIYATYHSTADGLDLRSRYYADRRVHFPPDHERRPDQDYSEGWKRYGFAAPFKRGEDPTQATYPLNKTVLPKAAKA